MICRRAKPSSSCLPLMRASAAARLSMASRDMTSLWVARNGARESWYFLKASLPFWVSKVFSKASDRLATSAKSSWET